MKEAKFQRLLEDSESEDSENGVIFIHRGPSRLNCILTHIVFGGLVFIITSSWFVFNAKATLPLRSEPAVPKLYSPTSHLIEYQTDVPDFDYWSNPLYFGPPSQEGEQAWQSLLHTHGVQLRPNEVAHLNPDETDTIILPNGNSLFMFAVMHNLHCLRRIHQTLYSDHYYKDTNPTFLAHDLHHTSHCLESIRTSLLCQPDLNLNRYYWSNRTIHNLSVRPDVERECINWDAIQGFMNDRPYTEDDIMESRHAHPEQAIHYAPPEA